MATALNYIDIHSHILPGIDDGAADVASAVALVAALAELGFAVFHPTPHQRAGLWAPTTEERQQAAADLRAALSADPALARLEIQPPAAENMWDELFLARQADGAYPCYAGDKAFLLELMPATTPPHLESRLFDFQVKHGRLPVLAHVERYTWLPDGLEGLATRAALLVNLGTVGGQSGWRLKRRARRLLRQGTIHAVATDAHGEDDISYIRAGLRWIRAEMGDQGVADLLVTGPRRILSGEIP